MTRFRISSTRRLVDSFSGGEPCCWSILAPASSNATRPISYEQTSNNAYGGAASKAFAD